MRQRSPELTCRAKAPIVRLAKGLEALARQADRGPADAVSAVHSFSISALLEQVKFDWQQDAEEKQLGFTVTDTYCMVQSDPRVLASILESGPFWVLDGQF